MDNSLLKQFNHFLSQQIGLGFKEDRLHELQYGMKQTALQLGYENTRQCMLDLLAAPLTRKQMDILSSNLTVGETYFFRDETSFQLLELHLLPAIVKQGLQNGKQSLNIWSAACSSGEEAYSIAIVLDRQKELLRNWTIRLLATDINLEALAKAQTAQYSDWAFRDCPAWVKQLYFTPATGNNMYTLKPHIKEMVHFEYLNLVDDSLWTLVTHADDMDIIFCRNVLMYFLPSKAQGVAARLARSLVDGGVIIVAPTDAFHLMDMPEFERSPESNSVFIKVHAGQHRIPQQQQGRNTHHPCETLSIDSLPFIPMPVPLKEVNPNEFYNGVMEVYRSGRYRAVIKEVEKGVDGFLLTMGFMPYRSRIFSLLARSYANLGRLPQARQWCLKAIDADKLEADNYYLKAVILQEESNIDQSIQALKQCLYIDQNVIMAHFMLGNIMFVKGLHKQSQRSFKNALQLLEPLADETVLADPADPGDAGQGLTAGRLRSIINATMATEQEVQNEPT